MRKDGFRIDFAVREDPQGPVLWDGVRAEVGDSGIDEVEFLISPNKGEELKPLHRIASGGELSRVMLVLKAILARVDRVPCLVFDEIDVGIGGMVAHRVGEKLAQVARHHQVFVITHLPQIAVHADHHLMVEKTIVEGRAVTRVEVLEDEARVTEIARMLGGDPASQVSQEHARELLAGAGTPRKRKRA